MDMMKRPRRFGFPEIRRMLTSNGGREIYKPLVFDEFAVIRDSSFIRELVDMDTPYINLEIRMGIVISGHLEAVINLMPYEVHAGDIVVLNYGAILQPMRASDDLRLMGILMSPELLTAVVGSDSLAIFNNGSGALFIPHGDAELALARSMVENIWQFVDRYGYRREVIVPALRMYANFLNMLYSRSESQSSSADGHGNAVFSRFIELVNKHCEAEHNIDFYARKVFLTSHYLGTLVKQVSGLTAKEWIDRAIVTKAKIMLKNTDLQSAQISDRLNFPNASFFSKYFKRLTGMTPQQYRES